MSWRHACTLSDRDDIEQEFGVRYTKLLFFYFDTSRFIMVDPMHNMLLGMGLLSDSNFDLIQSHVDKFMDTLQNFFKIQFIYS